MKKFIKEIKPYAKLYRDDKTGIAWIEDGSTGLSYSIHPNIDDSGSVRGMKSLGYWDKYDKIVRTHGFKYNISKTSIDGELDEIVSTYCQCEECRTKRNMEITKYMLSELNEQKSDNQ